MMQRRVFGATEPRVTIGSKVYLLATQQGRPVFSSGTRAIEGAPNDDGEIVMDDWSGGLGSRGQFYSFECMTIEPGRLRPRPKLNTLSHGGLGGVADGRYFFEEQDASGNFYLYLVAQTSIFKFQLNSNGTITARAVVTASGGAPFDADDRFGQPVKGLQTGTTVKRYVPLNNGNRIMRLTTVGVDAAADTWDAVTTVVGGASHFQQLPSGKIVRSVADLLEGVAQNSASISIKTAGSLFEPDASWGGDFQVDDQSKVITALFAWDELIMVGKRNGWFSAVEQGDGTIAYRNLLPDALPFESTFVHRGCVWHGKALLPTAGATWRHNLASAAPVDPDSILSNFVDEPNIPDNPRGAFIPTLEPAGEFLYAPYVLSLTKGWLGSAFGYYILSGREPRPGEGAEIVWEPITKRSAFTGCLCMHVQRTGPQAPRLFWQRGAPVDVNGELLWIRLNNDGGLAARDGDYGDASATGSLYREEYEFPCRVLFREARFEIDAGDPNLTWLIDILPDSGAAVQIGAGVATSGSVFWTPGTSDQARRARFRLRWSANANYNPVGNNTRLRKVTVYFNYLPDVSDDLVFVVDVAATAQQRKVSQKAVRDELAGYRGSRQAWRDPYGAAGQVVVQTTDEALPPKTGALEGRETITVKASLQEYT